MSDVELLWANKLEYQQGWGIHGHSHEYRQIFFITDGDGIFQVGEQEVHFTPGCCILIQPDQEHCMPSVQCRSVRLFDLKFTVNWEELDQSLRNLPSCFALQDPEFIPLLSRIRHERKSSSSSELSPKPFHQQLAAIYLEEFLYLILREQSAEIVYEDVPQLLDLSQNYPYITNQIIQFLKENYNQNFSLDELAERLAYNKTYLCKIFKSTTGYSIKQFVTLLRIQRATELISSSGKKLSDISEEVGYSDIHHFSRVYKRVLGKNPSDMRDQEKADICSDLLSHGQFTYRYFDKSSVSSRKKL